MKNLMPHCLSELFALTLSCVSLVTFIGIYLYR
ncbi:hypothetical protein J2X14_002831 [Pantoea alhagi]|nr:hypothetical protein [Pantoea alhagi]